jgi:hypothetical protein
MDHKVPINSGMLPLQFNKRLPRVQSWWAPVWRGLVVDHAGNHYRSMHTAVWLYLYLIVHADRKTGTLFRRINTIALEMGVKPTSVRRWLTALVQGGYVTRIRTGRSVKILIVRWKPLQARRDR